jgi:hypothetical protein
VKEALDSQAAYQAAYCSSIPEPTSQCSLTSRTEQAYFFPLVIQQTTKLNYELHYSNNTTMLIHKPHAQLSNQNIPHALLTGQRKDAIIYMNGTAIEYCSGCALFP